MIQKQVTRPEQWPLPNISMNYSRVYLFPPIDLPTQTQVLTDEGAYKLVKEYLLGRKKNGLMGFSVLDLTCDLGLPLDQANRVIEQLQAEKKISET